MPSDFDAVTDDALAYLRLHGRNTDGYLKGKSWPSASRGATRTRSWRRSPSRVAGAGGAGAGGPRGLQQQPGRRRPYGRPAFPRAAGPGAGGRGAATALAAAQLEPDLGDVAAWFTPQRSASRSTRNSPQPLSSVPGAPASAGSNPGPSSVTSVSTAVRPTSDPQDHGLRLGMPDAVRHQLGHEQTQRLHQRRVDVGAQRGQRAAGSRRGLGSAAQPQADAVVDAGSARAHGTSKRRPDDAGLCSDARSPDPRAVFMLAPVRWKGRTAPDVPRP